MTPKEELYNKVQAAIRSGNPLEQTFGAFGDVENCDGYVEYVLRPKEGGTFTKWFGVKQLFKGNPDGGIVEGIGFGKAFLSVLPREILARSFLFQTAAGLLFVFSRRRFIHYARVYFNTVCLQLVKKINLPRERYNVLTNELRRAVDSVIERELTRIKSPVKIGELLNGNVHLSTPAEMCELIANIFEFVYLFLEYDNAYRFRLQDILYELNKEALKRSVPGEINRILNILIEREYQVKHKWIGLKKLLIPALYLSPTLRKWVREILLELDMDKMKFDADDWYFCLNRFGYRFRGIPHSVRLEEKKRIDTECGNYKLTIMDIIPNDPTKKKSRGITILPFEYKPMDNGIYVS